MNIHLYLVFIVLKCSQYSNNGADSNIFLSKPSSKISLSLLISNVASWTTIFEPQDAGHYTSRVIDSKEKAIVLPDLKHYGTRDGYFSEQKVISEDKEDLV